MTTANTTNPFAFPAMDNNPFVEAWQGAMQEQMQAAQDTCASLQAMQAESVAKLSDAIDEVTRIWKAQLNYMSELQGSWQKMATEAVERTAAATRKDA